MLLRSALTANPVLGGAVAGVIFTVSTVLLAGRTDAGEARPKPEGCAGSPPQEFGGAALSRGIGPMMTKSLALILVSMHPFPLRTAAVVLLRVAVDEGQFVAPYATRSTVRPPIGHAPARAVVVATSATLAAVPLMPIVPTASAAGSG